MKQALEFLATHKDVAFATVGTDQRPKLRVFQIMKQTECDLYFATAAHKEVYTQLQANPYVEILAMEGMISVRISGKVGFDVPDEIGKEIYDTNAVLQRLYESYTSMVYFRMPMERLDYYDLTPTPPVLLSFAR